jgi:nucleotide-binding universal stress UspA family protein
MISLKNILVPVDFSEPSKKALKYGLTLAQQFKVRLILAHIVPESTMLPYAFPTDMLEIEKRQVERARREMPLLIPVELNQGLDLQTIVATGTVEAELLRIVRDDAVDLVVMGTHGRRRLGRWFIGSVTEHMLRKVPVPVITVSHLKSEKQPMGLVSIKRVLYATDLFESSNTGLKYAVEFAHGIGARLTLIHAIYYRDQAFWSHGSIPDIDNERIRIVRELQKKLDEVFEQGSPQNIQIEMLVVEGKPSEKILQVAEDREEDIIVLNLQSKTRLERALIGSTAEAVVRLATIPVLSVPSGGR